MSKEKNLKKFGEKVFTKKKKNDSINKNRNTFINCKTIYERDDLQMKKKEDIQKEKFINLLFKICLDLGIENKEEEIEKFLKQNKH